MLQRAILTSCVVRGHGVLRAWNRAVTRPFIKVSQRWFSSDRHTRVQSTLSPPPGVMPRNPSEIMSSLQAQAKSMVESAPQRVLSFGKRMARSTGRGIVEFVKDPRVALVWRRQLSASIKEIAHHYWIGTKLLAADIRIAYRLLKQVTRGQTLTRRERKQLLNTAVDIFRIVPMAIFIIVPFMELLLPIALRLFPNMLPSTFEDKLKKEENLKRSLKAKIELAKFLQTTTEEMAEQILKYRDGESEEKARVFKDFIQKVRNGQEVSNADMIKFSSLFKDEITLDNMSRPQLVAMCRYMSLNAFGSNTLLRFRIRNRLRQIKSDDRLIYWEGVSTLSIDELQQACLERGMNAKGVSRDVMRRQLKEWLELSMNHNVPSSLLIMSRAFLLTADSAVQEGLQQAIGSLPDEVVETVLADTETDERKRREQRLEMLERQNELIEEEGLARETTSSPSIPESSAPSASVASHTTPSSGPSVDGVSSSPETNAETEGVQKEFDEDRVTTDSLIREISKAVGVLAAASGVLQERAELAELKSDRAEVLAQLLASRLVEARPAPVGEFDPSNPRTSVEVSDQVALESDEYKTDAERDREKERAVVQARYISRLGALDSKLSSMLDKLEREISKVDKEIGSSINLIDHDKDGIVTREELETVFAVLRDRPSNDRVVEYIMKQLDSDGDGKVVLRDLEKAMEVLRELEVEPVVEDSSIASSSSRSPKVVEVQQDGSASESEKPKKRIVRRKKTKKTKNED